MTNASSDLPGKRIALVAPFGLRAKGTTRARVMPLGRALAARGSHVCVFVPPYDSPEDGGARYADGDVEIVHASAPVSLRRRRTLDALWMAASLYRQIVRWHPDIVQIFKPKGPSGLVGALLWYRRRLGGWNASIRLVVDADDWEGDGGWNDDPRSGYSMLERWVFRHQERFGCTHADAWTATTQVLVDRAIALGADRERVRLMPNGVPVHALAPTVPAARAAQAADPGPVVVLYTRFAGVHPGTVREIWSRVRDEVGEARLLVIGEGLAGEERSLRDLPGVTLAGWAAAGALPSIMAGAHVAMVPWDDSPRNRGRSSSKVRELMALGLAIVAFEVGELSVVVGDGGIVVAPDDREAFARAIVDLLRNTQRAIELGNAARERVTTVYDWAHIAEIALQSYGVQ